MPDTERIMKRIDDVEARLDHLRHQGVETRSLRSCLGIARLWLTDGSTGHADAICDEIVNVANKITDPDPAPAGDLQTTAQAAADGADVSARLLALEQRLREHFSRELGQAFAARPWKLDRAPDDRAAAAGPTAGLGDQLDLVRAQIEEVRKLLQEGGAAGVSIAEVKSMIGAELEANGLESKLNRRSLQPGEPAPVPPFVTRLDARLMQLAHAQDRASDRLIERIAALERGLTATLARIGPPAAADAQGVPTGSWLQELENAMLPETAPVGETRQMAAPDAPVTPMPGTGPVADGVAVEATEAPTVAVVGGLVGAARAAPAGDEADAPAEVPAAREDDERIRAIIRSEMSRAHGTLAAAPAPMSDAEFTQRLARLLPEALRLPEVREVVLAVVAVEAATNPGALAELTGVRAFLRRELLRQVDELKKALVIGEPV